MSSDGEQPAFTPPSFRKADRFKVAPPGELGGIEGTRGPESTQERLIATCPICSAILIERRGFVVCARCRAIVHSHQPCSVIVDGRALCRNCHHSTFPYDHDIFLALAERILRPNGFNLRKRLGVCKERMKEVEETMTETGLLSNGKPTRTGLRTYYYMYQVLAFEPDVALLIREMEMKIDV